MKGLQNLTLAVLCAAGMAQAQATTYTLNLTGSVSDGLPYSFINGSTQYDGWNLQLSGLPLSLTLAQGDVVNATITLDQPYTIPASTPAGISTTFGLYLSSSSNPAIDTGTSGSTAFFNGGVAGPSGAAGTGSSEPVNSAVFFAPQGSITFDSVTSNFTITSLATPLNIDGASISYQTQSAVPIPGTAWLFGSGLIGLLYQRRRAA